MIHQCENLVVGSGPGGAITAYMLAKAGKDVLLIEEGEHFKSNIAQYTLDEMDKKYRSGGLTVSLGKNKIVYVEGRSVGGASEINAGLYHRPYPEILQRWQKDFQINDFGSEQLEPYFKANEKEISISTMLQGVGPSSRLLEKGAKVLGWKTAEVPRMWRYDNEHPQGTRQSMTETFIPKALDSGCRLLSRVRIKRIEFNNTRAIRAVGEVLNADGKKESVRINFKNIFICAGAIQTPFLLRRSGITQNIGNSLRMHPAVRMAALFSEAVNDNAEGVPVVQVQEFKPQLTLGGSYSSRAHLALWLAGRADLKEKLDVWQNLHLFYALVVGHGSGRVRHIPLYDDPLVFLDLTDEDQKALGDGIRKLEQLLFAAGAREIFPPVIQTDVSTIHLFASCPMGENKNISAVDSFGKLHGIKNVYLNDSSILPDAPAVNPQALIMAIARRNIEYYLT